MGKEGWRKPTGSFCGGSLDRGRIEAAFVAEGRNGVSRCGDGLHVDINGQDARLVVVKLA
jgi:hypothetical protein